MKGTDTFLRYESEALLNAGVCPRLILFAKFPRWEVGDHSGSAYQRASSNLGLGEYARRR